MSEAADHGCSDNTHPYMAHSRKTMSASLRLEQKAHQMDPQACLSRLIEAMWQLAWTDRQDKEQYERTRLEVAEALDDLGDWLRKGGYAPRARGPVFGVHQQPMDEKLRDRPIRHTMAGALSGYTMRVVSPDDSDCLQWEIAEYAPGGRIVRCWPLLSVMKCPHCKHETGEVSMILPNRCTVCEQVTRGSCK